MEIEDIENEIETAQGLAEEVDSRCDDLESRIDELEEYNHHLNAILDFMVTYDTRLAEFINPKVVMR